VFLEYTLYTFGFPQRGAAGTLGRVAGVLLSVDPHATRTNLRPPPFGVFVKIDSQTFVRPGTAYVNEGYQCE